MKKYCKKFGTKFARQFKDAKGLKIQGEAS